MNRRGASLIEVLLSFTLTALMIVLLLNLFPASMATVRQAEQRQLAGALAESVLERQSTLPFDRLLPGSSQDLPPALGDGGVEYRLRFAVTPVSGEDPQFLRALTVTVSWQHRGKNLNLVRQLLVHRLSHQI